MIKLKDLIKEVKVGSARIGLGGRGKEIEIVVDKAMAGKWKLVYFNMAKKYVSGVGVSPERLIDQKPIKLSSSEKNIIKKIIKNPEDIAYMADEYVKPIDVIRALNGNG
jgi:hypothetical protein|tara:strand:- start:344 stop:670 length:327 start_codon:yes stop_codon:yes gene_type:complete